MSVTANRIDYNVLVGANIKTHGNCPKCKLCFDAADIPAENLHYYRNPDYPQTRPDKFSNLISIEIPGVYDGGIVSQCPGCSFMWHRFTGVEVTDLTRVTKTGVF